MQLYRGMDIGTAKPDARRARRRAAPPARPLARAAGGVGRRVPAAARAPRSTGCARPGRVPLLVGGSGLYVRAVLDELEFPGTDAAVRARLEARAGRRRRRPRCTSGWPALDPAAAAAVLPSNGRRIVRALEVIELTGGPFRARAAGAAAALSGRRRRAWTASRPSSTSGSRCGWTACGRPASSTRCAALAADGLREGPTASRALGYAQVLAQFDGDLTAEEARERTVQHHPPVRPPPALVVPPRPGAHLVRRGPARPGRRRRLGDHRPYDRGVTSTRSAGAPRARHRERLRRAARPRRHVWPESRLDAAMVRRLCDRRAGLGGDGVLRVVRSRARPRRAGRARRRARPLRVVHGPPQRRRLARGDVRQRHPALPARARHRGAARPRHVRGRRPGRHPRRPPPRRRDPRRRLLGRHGPRPAVRRGRGARWRARSSPAWPSRWATRTWPALTDVDVDTLDLDDAPGVRRRRCSPTA